MVIEEPSVIAADSRGAKIARVSGGFKAECGPSHTVGQIQILKVKNLKSASDNIKKSSSKILRMANNTLFDQCDLCPYFIQIRGVIYNNYSRHDLIIHHKKI